MVCGYLEQRKARCPVCLPFLRLLPTPPCDPPSCPRVPSTSKLHSLNGIVADQVHSLAPGAAPDADAATGVDGTAQPIGRCPHHLRREDKAREAVRRTWARKVPALAQVRVDALAEVFLGDATVSKVRGWRHMVLLI